MNIADVLIDIKSDIKELYSGLTNVIWVGKVLSVDSETGTLVAEIKKDSQANSIPTPPIKFVAVPTAGGLIWSLPKVGNSVMIMSISGNFNNAYALPFIPQTEDLPDDFENDEKTTIKFSDKAVIVADNDILVVKNDKARIRLEEDRVLISKDGVLDCSIEMTEGQMILTAGTSTVTINTTEGVAVESTFFTWNGAIVAVV